MKAILTSLLLSLACHAQAAEPTLYWSPYFNWNLLSVPLSDIDGPATVVTGLLNPIDASSNEDFILFTNGGTLSRLQYGATQPEMIHSFNETIGYINTIAVRDGWIFVAQGRQIYRSPLAALNFEIIITNPDGYISDLVCDGIDLYWADEEFGLYSAPVSGGPRSVVTESAGSPMALTFRENTLYWFEDGTQQLRKINKDGTDELLLIDLVEVIGPANYIPQSISIANDRIWWSDSGVDHIFHCNIDGTDVITLQRPEFTSGLGWVFPNSESEVMLEGQPIISQEVMTSTADYDAILGQAFTLHHGQTVGAIQLHLDSIHFGGGSIRLTLWRTVGEPGHYFSRNGDSPVAEGELLQSTIADTPGWHTIHLDRAYTNHSNTDQYLVFDIEFLTSGLDGYNDFSISNQNSYEAGELVYWDGKEYENREGEDLAFRILSPPGVIPTLKIPPPRIIFRMIQDNPPRTQIEVELESSRVGFDYTLFGSEDLDLPVEHWADLGTEVGRGGAINWSMGGYGPERPRYFFKVRAIPRAP